MRISLSLSFLKYGIGKVTGTMFNNATEEILNMKLKEVDMFHLTWYWFHANVLISYSIGIIQIIGSLLILYERTKLLGAIILFPIAFGIFLVDISCNLGISLILRVFYFNFICLLVIYRSIEGIKIIPSIKFKPSIKQVLYAIIIGFGLEIVFVAIGNFISFVSR